MDMASHPLLALAADDPPPFPSAYPQLQRLDRSVVCPICKEPFTGPVSISCGHSFCSQCIRASLDAMKDKKCPSCDEKVTEGSIRRNRALEEIADAWDAARPTLITLSQPHAGPSRKRPPPEPISKASSSSSNPTKRSRHASVSRSRSPSKSRAEEIEEDEEDDIEELSENDEGECPICSARMPIASIPFHIERGCPPPKAKHANGTGNQRSDWKKVFAGAGQGKGKEVEMKRILKPNYELSNPADLRAILSEYGLATTGDKPTLKARVQEWIILFNANLDTSHPRSISALRAQLKAAEESRRRDLEKGKMDLIEGMKSQEGMEKYKRDSRSEFERLRKEVMERDAKRKGRGRENPIEVD